jgi:hypothetical protein
MDCGAIASRRLWAENMFVKKNKNCHNSKSKRLNLAKQLKYLKNLKMESVI